MVIKHTIIALLTFVGLPLFGQEYLRSMSCITNLVYDTNLEHCASCVSDAYAHANRFVYWDAGDLERRFAIWASLAYSRYTLAPRFLPIEKWDLQTISNFATMRTPYFSIDSVCVTNMDVEVFTFKVENPYLTNQGKFALIKFLHNSSFVYSIYVNLSTGESNMDFHKISKAWMTLTRELAFPYLTRLECIYQKRMMKLALLWSENTERNDGMRDQSRLPTRKEVKDKESHKSGGKTERAVRAPFDDDVKVMLEDL